MKEIVVLYSGGTDSTCAAALVAEKFDRVYLLTYDRFGLFSIDNSRFNVNRLRDKFGKDKFVHEIINIDKLFKEVSYAKYFYNLFKYRFFLLSTCGLCKLTMHIRSIIYCLENNIKQVCDGSNKNMSLFPAQMSEVIKEIKNMYLRFGINFNVPVYEYGHPKDIGYLDRMNPEIMSLLRAKSKAGSSNHTTGKMLFKMGILPVENVKGTKMDKKMQARCFQLILFNIFLRWYYLPTKDIERYQQACINFYKEKIDYFGEFIEEYINSKEKSRLKRLL